MRIFAYDNENARAVRCERSYFLSAVLEQLSGLVVNNLILIINMVGDRC